MTDFVHATTMSNCLAETRRKSIAPEYQEFCVQEVFHQSLHQVIGPRKRADEVELVSIYLGELCGVALRTESPNEFLTQEVTRNAVHPTNTLCMAGPPVRRQTIGLHSPGNVAATACRLRCSFYPEANILSSKLLQTAAAHKSCELRADIREPPTYSSCAQKLACRKQQLIIGAVSRTLSQNP